jgi:uncharacterized protein (UPF0212 family)
MGEYEVSLSKKLYVSAFNDKQAIDAAIEKLIEEIDNTKFDNIKVNRLW